MYRFEEKNSEGTGEAVGVELTVQGMAGTDVPVQIYRIDREHANAYRAWLARGRPKTPTGAQMAEIAAQAQLVPESSTAAVENHAARIALAMPPNAMALVVVGEEVR